MASVQDICQPPPLPLVTDSSLSNSPLGVPASLLLEAPNAPVELLFHGPDDCKVDPNSTDPNFGSGVSFAWGMVA